jgi:Protein kinase domain
VAVRCSSCGALLNPRATRCAVCDAPIATVADRAPIGVQVSLGGMAALPADELQLAAELGKALAPSIHLRRRIGRGGMGIVFLARDESLKRDVAIKVLAPDFADDVTTRLRFTREAEAAAAVSHPNIVNIYHVGILPKSEIPYFVMQYVEGPSVADAAGRMLPEARVRRIIGEVASGLAAAHRRGVVHRDIKPGNIVIDGETGRALLLDFGISAAVAEAKRASRPDRLTSEGMYVGTPTYMSPEMASGDDAIDKSDIYSLGVVAYEMLTGKPPFDGKGLRVMAAHVNDPLPDLHRVREDLSPELVALIERALAKNPADRPSAQAIVDHLLPASRQSIEWPPPGLAPLRRASAFFRIGLVALVATIAAFVFVLWVHRVPAHLENGGARALAILDAVRRGGSGIESTQEDIAAIAGDVVENEARWAAAAYAALALVLVAVVFAAIHSARALRFARIARRSGYPWGTIADVMSDMRRDGGDLVNGLGIYAFSSERERRTLLAMRRIRLAGIISATILAVGAMVAWVSGWFGSTATQGASPLTPGAARWMVALPGAVIAFCGVLAVAEAIVRRRRAQADEEWQGAHVVKRELVSNWVVSAGRKLASTTALYLVPIEGIIGVLLIAAVVASLVIANAAMTTSIRSAYRRSVALAWVGRDFADTARASRWRVLDRALDRSAGRLTHGAPPVESRTQEQLLAAFIPPSVGTRSLLPRAAADSALFVGGSRPEADADIGDALSRLPASPDESTMLNLAVHAPKASMNVWRSVAHGALLPRFWPYRGDATELESPASDAFSTANEGLQTLATANLFEGIDALSRRDFATGELRARENLAVVRQLDRGGTTSFAAPEALIDDAASVLEWIGRKKPDAGLFAEAADLRSAMTRPTAVHSAAPALFADPDYLPVTQIIADTMLAPAVRVRLAEHTAVGFCSNPHEVMFGVDPARLALVRRARESLADLAGASKLLIPWERWLGDAIRTGVARPVVNHLPNGGALTRPAAAATTLFRLTGLRSRLTYCGLG